MQEVNFFEMGIGKVSHIDWLLSDLLDAVNDCEDIDPFTNSLVNEYCSLHSVLLKMMESTDKAITETVKRLTQILKYYFSLAINGFLQVFDLSDYDPLFDLSDPPILDKKQLSKALKAIYHGDNVEKYKNIGFKLEDIKRMLETIREQTKIQKQQNEQELKNPTIEEPITEEIKDLVQAIKRSNLKPEEQKAITRAIKTNKREWDNACNIIYSFLYVYGGEDVANNPRRYFEEGKGEVIANYKKSSGNQILINFQLKGLAFPVSGKTLEKYKPQNKITLSKD